MKFIFKILFVSFLLIFIQSCSKNFKCKDDELTIPRTENNTNKLKWNILQSFADHKNFNY